MSARDPAPEQPISLGPPAIHAPWRMAYLEDLTTKEAAPASGALPVNASASFFCDYWRTPEADEKNHVVVRAGRGLILLNAFPYAAGHLLVALSEARPTLLDYTPDQRAALWRLTDAAAALVQAAFQPQGINIGVNQGRAAGAGVPAHLHVHLVPRWGGDVNFISVVGQVRVVPAALDHTAARYRSAWQTLRAEWEPLLSGELSR